MRTAIALGAILALGSLAACGTPDPTPTTTYDGIVTDLSFRYGSSTCVLNVLQAPSNPKPPAPAVPKPVVPKPVAPAASAPKAASVAPARTGARVTYGYNGGGVPAQKPVVRPVVNVYHPMIVRPYGNYGYGYSCYRTDCWQITFRMESGQYARDCVPWSEYVRYSVSDHYPRYRDGD